MKQTAVEWLVKELNQKIDFIPMDKWDMIRDIIDQAKEMEKEQMALCYKVGVIDGNSGEILNFENYYKETFKSE